MIHSKRTSMIKCMNVIQIIDKRDSWDNLFRTLCCDIYCADLIMVKLNIVN